MTSCDSHQKLVEELRCGLQLLVINFIIFPQMTMERFIVCHCRHFAHSHQLASAQEMLYAAERARAPIDACKRFDAKSAYNLLLRLP